MTYQYPPTSNEQTNKFLHELLNTLIGEEVWQHSAVLWTKPMPGEANMIVKVVRDLIVHGKYSVIREEDNDQLTSV